MDWPIDLAPDLVPDQPTTVRQPQQHQGPQPMQTEAVGSEVATNAVDAPQRDVSMEAPSEPAVKHPSLTSAAAPAPTTKQAGLTALERQTALNMLNILSKYKEAEPFRQPVDWEFLKIPEYPLVITQPMDLRTCREKVRNGAYNNIEEWKTDVQRIWDNCRKFNGEDHFVTKQAEKLQQHFERRMGEAQAAAARDLAALQQRGGDGAANNAGKVPSKPKNREVAQLGAPSASDGESGDDRLGLAKGLAGRAGQRSPEPLLLRLPLKRAASGSNLQAAAAAAAGDAVVDGGAAVTGAGRAPSAAHKRRVIAGSGGHHGAAGGVARGLDLDALELLSQTPAAKQLGIGDTDDLAFLAVWKRVMGRKQQALQDLDSLKSSSKKAERHLKVANDRIAELANQVEQEKIARRLAEQHLQELQQQHSQLQDDFSQLQQKHHQQDKVLDQQKAVLEQQQQVLRTILQQQRQQQQQSQGNAPTSAQAQARGPPAVAESPPSAPASAVSGPSSSGQQQQQQPALLHNQSQQISSIDPEDDQQHQVQQEHNQHLRQQQVGSVPQSSMQGAAVPAG